MTPHRSWTSAATLACFPTRLLYVCPQPEHGLLTDRLPSRQFLLELLLSSLLHAISADRPHSLSRSASLVRYLRRLKPIANTRCRRTSGFLQTALSDLLRTTLISTRKSVLRGAAPIEY